ncbi:MAG: hypothetical protein ABIR24_03525 [Verrucomicrobiota bacterium]
MIKLIQSALRRLAIIIVAWTRTVRQQSKEKSAAITPPPTVLPAAVEKTPVTLPEATPIRPTEQVGALPIVPEVAKPEGTSRIAPERRGGGQIETEDGAQPGEQRTRTRSGPQLRVICFKGNDRMWRLAVELPEDCSAVGDIEIRQDGQPLERVGFDDYRWPLHRLNGNIEAASTGNGGQHWELQIGGDECLLFKLLEEGATEEGRLVSVSSHGQYLVVLPGDWPVPDFSGVQLSRERNVGILGYVAYRFRVGDSVHPRLEFQKPGGQRAPIRFRTPCFTLAGERADAVFGEYQASLFLKSPPRVCAPDAESWSHVEKIVLGVAGKGRNHWKKAIKPNPTNTEVQLSEHLNGRKGGWYFLRFYDTNEMLIESHYFAFAASVRGINALGASALPGVHGHAEARLGFEHDTDVAVELLGDRRLDIQNWPGCTVFTVPASVSWERIDCQICAPGQTPIKCTTLIERIWWALGSEAAQPTDSEWADKPVTGKREYFRAASDKVLFVRLQSTRLADTFWVGFNRDVARPYFSKAEERSVPIRLGDFVGSDQIQNTGVSPFSIWIWQNGQEICAEVLRLEIAFECSFCAKRFRADAEALAHAIEHEKEFIQELSYEDLRRLNPELPAAIYQCLYPDCGFYAREDDPYATSVITSHIQAKHGSPYYPTPISFRSVTDLDEIRQKVKQHLPQIFKCNKCGEKFENVRPEDFAEHIFRKHRSQLFNLV